MFDPIVIKRIDNLKKIHYGDITVEFLLNNKSQIYPHKYLFENIPFIRNKFRTLDGDPIYEVDDVFFIDDIKKYISEKFPDSMVISAPKMIQRHDLVCYCYITAVEVLIGESTLRKFKINGIINE